MFIIIAGGGKQGYYLAKDLKRLEHEVVVIEKDEHVALGLRSELGSRIRVGDACEDQVLLEAGAERADFIAAVTGEDEDNLVICQVAKSVCPNAITIARVNNPDNSQFFSELGIDAPVSATNLIVHRIEDQITSRSGALTSLLLFEKSGFELVEMRLQHDSPATGQALRSLSLPKESTLVMVTRGETSLLPDGNTVFDEGDVVVALTRPMHFGKLRNVFIGPGS